MSNEFDVIKQYFTFPDSRADVILSGGDDCAIVSVAENKQLVITADTLISGVHFPEDSAAQDIAYKSIMVNLSDLAAMGATPAWLTLAITLPDINESWLRAFSQQFSKILSKYNIALVGGDTTKGPLSITIQAMGLVDKDKALRRDQAKAGDKIYVTGDLGDAAIGLYALQNKLNDEKLQACINRLNRPEARLEFAQELVSYASCAIDISDGLVADLGHIVKASRCGAQLNLAAMPLSESAKYYFTQYHKSIIDWAMLLTRGDDYELCFTVCKNNQAAVETLAAKCNLKLSCIGKVIEKNELIFFDAQNKPVDFIRSGFKHF